MLHEVSMHRCARVTRVVRRVGAKANALPTFEGLPNIASFLEEFEEKITESQRRWWGTHNQSISEWPQCRRLMEIIFGEEISYFDQKYT